MLDDPVLLARFGAEFPSARRLFEEYLEASRPSLPAFPSHGVTALQFTLFDNGQPTGGNVRRKRITKTRYGLNLKAWDRLRFNWTQRLHIAWEGSAALWCADEASEIVERLVERGLSEPETHSRLRDLIEMSEADGLYSLFLQRARGAGSRWTEVLLYVRMKDGMPEAAFVLLPDGLGYEAATFDVCTAQGQSLGPGAIAQARVAFSEALAKWSSN